MEINSQKRELINWILSLKDENIISDLINMKDMIDNNCDVSEFSKDELKSILKGLEDVKDGNVYSHEDVRKIYEKYL